MSKVATLFAFSPYVALNIGGVQIAIFNWLDLKNQNEIIYLRIKNFINKSKKKLIVLQIP